MKLHYTCTVTGTTTGDKRFPANNIGKTGFASRANPPK